MHRDIKLENIIFAEKDDLESLKIIDFGLSVYEYDKVSNHICGTPGYMAPEILN